MKLLFVYLVIAVALCAVKSDHEKKRKVLTTNGLVVGKVEHTVVKSIPYYSFRGIPYAEPPVKNLRFQPPQPKKPWKVAWYATSDRESCIQSDKINIFGSEDCLYLNVYAPITNISPNDVVKTHLKPVMVWIHGGNFYAGSANKSHFGPDFLVEEDVVVVVIQYRLGPLGFLNVNHPSASGNNGLKDQNMALKWVQKNIASFGGDPKQVTLIGQSAGGVSVDLHKLSPMSSGLFKQTISMSASPLCMYWAFQNHVEARAQAFLLASKLGFIGDNEESLLNFLKNTPAIAIIKASSDLPGLPFRPTLEKADSAPDVPKFMTECAPKLYQEGRYNKGPHMMGFMKDEMLYFADGLDKMVEYLALATKLMEDLNPLLHLLSLPKILPNLTQDFPSFTETLMKQIIFDLSNLFFITGIDTKQQLLSAKNEYPIYYYRYTFNSPYSLHRSKGIKLIDGAAHEDELANLFYRPDLNIPLDDNKISILRRRFVQLWTNFAKYGNPTPNNPKNDRLLGVNWTDSTKDGSHLEIGNELEVKPRPTNLQVQLLQSLGLGDFFSYNECSFNTAKNTTDGILGYFEYLWSKK